MINWLGAECVALNAANADLDEILMCVGSEINLKNLRTTNGLVYCE